VCNSKPLESSFIGAGWLVSKVIENVGSVTTLVVELLREQGARCNEKEATLLALGIHSDTGSLVFEGTTARDVSALQYCLECGASQKAIMRFAKVIMSLDQRNMLNKAMMKMRKIEFERVTLAFAHVECEEYVPGMATVARDMMVRTLINTE
jgi:tRNA nucleotidyltransferase (CCA-adding enzyme)